MEIGKFKLQVSFSLGAFVLDENICKAIQSEKKTRCDEYVENQLNVASKNFAKYVFVEKIGKNVWKIFAPGRANLRKMQVELSSKARPNCSAP